MSRTPDKADQAEQDAAAADRDASQANNESDKASRNGRAQAQTEAADSKAIAADCAKAFVSTLGELFEGESVSAQTEVVKQQLESISATARPRWKAPSWIAAG